MSRAASSGGGQQRIGRAARRYVAARGGARRAAQSAIGGRAATQRLGSFLGSLASRGFAETANAFNLARVLGQPIDVAIAAIASAIAPAGNTLEEAAARHAIDDALCVLYERLQLQDGDLNRLDAVDAQLIRHVLQEAVASYIYTRWVQEVGDRIEQWAGSPDDAVALERQVRQFVTATVQLDFAQVNVLQFDWASPQGHQMVETIYRDAYSLFEA